MKRGTPYVVGYVDGSAVGPRGSTLIAEHGTVSAKVRARRRNEEAGGPQAISTRTQ